MSRRASSGTTLTPPTNARTLSGNGQTILFADLDNTISKVSWDGSGPLAALVTGGTPTITDDGQTVFYRDGGIRKIAIDGTGATLILADAPQQISAPLALSGDGSRVALDRTDAPNSYLHRTLFAMDASGGDQRQLTNETPRTGSIYSATVVADGSRIYFLSDRDLVGSNAGRKSEIFTILPDGTGLAQVTNTPDLWNGQYSVTDAGTIVFQSRADLAGQNACHAVQLYTIRTNGTGLAQVTGCAGNPFFRENPQYLFNGQYIVFQGLDRVGSNLDGSAELFRILPNGTGLTPITADDDASYKYPRLSSTLVPGGYWIAYQTGSNADGMNPRNIPQIFRITLLGTGLQRITADPDYESTTPDISGDGNRIVFWSDADFLGTNPGHHGQVFLWDATTATKRQLTFSTHGVYDAPRISRNGAWVYFQEGFYGGRSDLVRVSVATGIVERVGGFGHATSSWGGIDIDSGGTHAVITGSDVIDRSPSAWSPFIADYTMKPNIAVGAAAPTVVTWDPDPDSVRYDVIRGDVANLAISGGTVDLGEVACIEDDSPDNHTRGHEDATQPGPGHAFFYLYRGTLGLTAAAGSWGQGSGNRERVAGAGGCRSAPALFRP